MIDNGIILMWSKTEIPPGWFKCDGENGTPDLKDKFIVGAGDVYATGEKGGTSSVEITSANMPNHGHATSTLVSSTDGNHTHALATSNGMGASARSYRYGGTTGTGTAYTSYAGAHTHTTTTLVSTDGADGLQTNLPAYYSLYFITHRTEGNESLAAPKGTIYMWCGDLSALPHDCQICNGEKGTPDLQNSFITGAGLTESVNSVGGSSFNQLQVENLPEHTHTLSGTLATVVDHTHTISTNSSTISGTAATREGGATGLSGIASSAAGAHSHSLSRTLEATGDGALIDNRPPYYALAYIMKM